MTSRTAPGEGSSVQCSNCQACCCQLKVMVLPDDAVPERYIDVDEYGLEVMNRLDDGWCAALDRDTMRCTIYAQRPWVCREFAMGSAECREERAQWKRIAISLR